MNIGSRCVCGAWVCGAWVCGVWVCVVCVCMSESGNDWRRANVLDQCGRVYEKWNRYNTSIVFVSKLVDMYIVFGEKLFVYLFCLQNKWKKYMWTKIISNFGFIWSWNSFLILRCILPGYHTHTWLIGKDMWTIQVLVQW